ncbi:hypothetical protein HDU86_007588 [Geranomyces michiganensis]|nr:hypothetical protein HDU86_007588 [Geranomyces michiganensis]
MNNLSSYLAAKVAQSRGGGGSGGTPTSRRATPAPQQQRPASPPSPTPTAKSAAPSVVYQPHALYRRQDNNNSQPSLSKRSSSTASGLSTAAPSTSRNGPLPTSPTPTTANSSPVFSPLRGLWGTPGVSPNKPKSINGNGGGLLDGFAFEFESLDPGIAFGLGSGGSGYGGGDNSSSSRRGSAAGFSDAFRAPSRVEDSRTSTSHEVSREGWLWTQSGHTWTKMYAALSGQRGAGSRSTGAQIQLYDNETDSHALRTISLTACTGVHPATPASTSSISQPAFRLVMCDSSRGCLFAADSRAERDRWVSALAAIVGEADEDDQDEDEARDEEEEEEDALISGGSNFRSVTPRPVPSAPAYDQMIETSHYGRRNSAGASASGVMEQNRSVGGLFGSRPAPLQSTPSSSSLRASVAAAPDLHAELSNVKDLVLRLLDAQIVAGDPGAGLEILREQLATAVDTIKDAARGITNAGEQLASRQQQKDEGAAAAVVATAAAAPSAELEAAVSELIESMEMRTSKIAKMVHELLTQTKANATPDTTVAEQKHAESDSNALEELNATVKKLVEKLESSETLSCGITDLAEQTSGLSAAQQQTAVDIAQLMTMIAAGNQRATGASEANLRSLSTEIQAAIAKHTGDVTTTSTRQVNDHLDAKTADIKEAIATTAAAHSKHADAALAPMMEILVEIRDRLSAAPPPGRGAASSGTGDRLDRPTTNMITAINDKLIHLSRVVDHVQSTQTARFSSLDTALAAAGSGASGTRGGDETEAAQMIQLHKLTDIGEGVAGLADRVARAGREAQTRHDVVDGRLDRIADQLKHMHRTVTKLVQVGMLGGDAGEGGSGEMNSAGGASGGAGGVAAALAEQRSVLGRMREDLGEIKEQLADDVTGARLADLLAMFAISQDTHSVVADKVSRIEALGETSAGAVQELQDKLKIAAGTVQGSDNTTAADADARALLQQVAAQIEKLGSAPSQNSAHKLIESIHSCLVSYLPIDLDSRLSSIQTSLGAISRSTSPIRGGGGAAPDPWVSAPARAASSPQDLSELLSCYHESAQREHVTAAALDSIQHSLARVLDCFDAHGLFQKSGPVPIPVATPRAAAANVIDVTELKELRDAVMEICNATAGRETVGEELAMLVGKRNELREEIAALEAQKMEVSKVGGGGQRAPKVGLVAISGASRRISCPPGIPIAPALER